MSDSFEQQVAAALAGIGASSPDVPALVGALTQRRYAEFFAPRVAAAIEAALPELGRGLDGLRDYCRGQALAALRGMDA